MEISNKGQFSWFYFMFLFFCNSPHNVQLHNQNKFMARRPILEAYSCCCRVCASSTILKKKTIFLSVNVFSTKVLIEDTIFVSPTGDGPAIFYVVIRLASSHKDLAVCKAKKFPSFFSHFKTLNIGPTLGIETRGLPRSTVMRSIDWTSPTALRHGGWAPRKGFSFSWTNVKF